MEVALLRFRVSILSLSAAILAWYAPAAITRVAKLLAACNRYRGLQNGAKGYLGKGTIMHKLVLKRFQVKNFRNIENSDWIPVERVTCFVGRERVRQDCLTEGNIQAESRQP